MYYVKKIIKSKLSSLKLHNWEKTFLLILIAIGFVLAWSSLKKPMTSEGDAYARSIIAYYYYQSKTFISNNSVWLPFHFTLLSLPLYFFSNFHLSVRVWSLIISLTSIPLLYLYSKIIFKETKIAVLASILLLVLPMRIVLSTHTLTEPVFISFLLASFVFFFKEKPNYLISFLLLNIAHGIRYESWFLLPILWLILLRKKIYLQKTIALIALSLVFPIYYLWGNAQAQGSCLAFFNEKYQVAQINQIKEYFDLFLSSRAWEKNLLDFIPLPFFLIIFINLKNVIKGKKVIFLIIPMYLFISLIIQVYLGTMEWFPPRYLYPLIVLLIPFISYSFIDLFTSIKKPIFRIFFLAILYLYLLLIYPRLFDFNIKRLESDMFIAGNNRADFFSVVQLATQLKKNYKNFEYYYLVNSRIRRFENEPFIYFTGLFNLKLKNKNQISEVEAKPRIMILEKNEQDHLLKNNYELILENDDFLVLKDS